MNDLIIREMQKRDWLDIATIADDEWKPKLTKLSLYLANYNGDIERCYIATKEGLMAGFIYGFSLPNKLLIPEMLYVRSEFRKQGIGTKLLETIEQKSGCNCSMIFYNKDLHNYYAQRGYNTGDNLETAIKDL